MNTVIKAHLIVIMSRCTGSISPTHLLLFLFSAFFYQVSKITSAKKHWPLKCNIIWHQTINAALVSWSFSGSCFCLYFINLCCLDKVTSSPILNYTFHLDNSPFKFPSPSVHSVNSQTYTESACQISSWQILKEQKCGFVLKIEHQTNGATGKFCAVSRRHHQHRSPYQVAFKELEQVT